MNANNTQRRVTLTLILLLLAGGLLLAGMSLFNTASLSTMSWPITLAFLVGDILLLVAFWRKIEQVRHAIVIMVALLTGFGMNGVFLTDYASLAILLPPVLAQVLVGPIWVVGSAVATLLVLMARAGFRGVYTDPTTLVIFVMVVGGMILARVVTEATQREAEAQTKRAEEALARSEAQGAEVAQKAGELTRQNDEQRRLIDLVATLETPAIALAEGVLLTPVIGHLDSRRAEQLIERLLREVSESRTRLVVLDIAGVPTVDTQVAHALLRAVQAVRLLGCDVTITGISASIATTITELGINMTGVRIARTPQEALQQAVSVGPAKIRRN